MTPGAAHQVEALLADSEAARSRGEYVLGAELAARAAAVAAAGSLPVQRAVALRSFANQTLRTGGIEDAIQACEDSAELLRGEGHFGELAETLLVLGLALLEVGLHTEALECLNEARQIAVDSGNQAQLYWVHNRLGVAYLYLGDHEQAERFLLQALARAEGLGEEALFCVLNNLAENSMQYVLQLRANGEPSRAAEKAVPGLRFAREALKVAEQSTNPYRRCLALGLAGLLQASTGEFDGAIELIEASRQIAVDRNYRSMELTDLLYRGQALAWSGRTAEAMPLLLRACDGAAEQSELSVQMTALSELSQAYERQGCFELALRAHKQYSALEFALRSAVAAARARMLARHVGIDSARLEVSQARTESELNRARQEELEADVQRLQARADQLELQAHRDPLTGVGNRRYLDAALSQAFAEVSRDRRQMSLAILDIDLFKRVNDTFGHDIGDQVLTRVAQLIVRHSRLADIIVRLGGEEFLLVLLDVDSAGAAQVCERLRAGIEAEAWHEIAPNLRVTVSLGICPWSGQHTTAELINRADHELYRAKAAGRNRIEVAAS